MLKRRTITLIILLIIFILPCEGQSYDEIRVGSQTWMTENLNVDHFRNGDPIPEARTPEEWKKAAKEGRPALCYYNNDLMLSKKYGKLYNWYAVIDPRGLAPAGWHIPSDQEWKNLEMYLGGAPIAGAKMKTSEGWYNNGNGNNNSGLAALPGGCRFNNNFLYLGKQGYWWSTTASDANRAWIRFLSFYDGIVFRFSYHKRQGLSVRCIIDA